jgi:Peptidase family S41
MRTLKWLVLIASIVILAGVLLKGCSVAPVNFAEQRTGGTLELPLKGRYEVAVHSFLIGSMKGRLAAEPSPESTSFIANSRPGIAWSMIGGIESAVGPLVMPSLFPGGVILVWESQLPGQDDQGTVLPGVGRFGAGKEFSVESRLTSPQAPIGLFYQDRRVGFVTLKKLDETPDSESDSLATVESASPDVSLDESAAPRYARIADAIEQALKTRIFDPSLAESSQVRAYMKKVRAAAAVAQDDIEFAFGTNLAWRNTLKVSQVGVLRELDPTVAGLLREGDGWEKSLLRLSYADFSGNPLDPTSAAWAAMPPEQGRVAIITCTWFSSADDIDRLMMRVTAEHRQRPLDGLIIDIKSCFGGSLAALRFVEWLSDQPAEVAVMYHHRARDHLNTRQLVGLPRVSPQDLGWSNDMGVVFSDSLDTLLEAIEPEGAAVLATTPVDADLRFDKPVCVLISRRTAGPAEALAEMLRRDKRAQLIGGKTAGRMLVPQRVDLGEGWILQLPAYDYATPTGRRIEGKPIEPDINISGGKAKGEALRQIRALTQDAVSKPQIEPATNVDER